MTGLLSSVWWRLQCEGFETEVLQVDGRTQAGGTTHLTNSKQKEGSTTVPWVD